MTALNLFLFVGGAITMGCLVIAIFFRCFWKRTGDRLFLFFAIAFLLLGIERLMLVRGNPADEVHFSVYTVRLAAFITLAIAIWDRNRRGS